VSYGRPVSHRAGTLLLCALSTLVALSLGEVGARVLFPRIEARPLLDASLGWSNAEYQRLAPIEEMGEGRRILFLGDSYLAGAGVSGLEKRFSAVLERELTEPATVRVLATGGWGTDQELLAMMQKGRPWRPDTVVLAFCPTNDLWNILSDRHPNPDPTGPPMRKPYLTMQEDGGLQLHDADGALIADAALISRIAAPPLFNSSLLALARYYVRNRSPEPGGALLPVAPDPRLRRDSTFADRESRWRELIERRRRLSWSPQDVANRASAYIGEDFATNAYQWKLLEAILAALRGEVEGIDGQLVVMLLPAALGPDRDFITGTDFECRFETPSGEFTFRLAEPRARLAAITRRLGIWFFDPTAGFIQHVIREDLPAEEYFGPDQHFGDESHRWLAAELRRYLTGVWRLRRGS